MAPEEVREQRKHGVRKTKKQAVPFFLYPKYMCILFFKKEKEKNI